MSAHILLRERDANRDRSLQLICHWRFSFRTVCPERKAEPRTSRSNPSIGRSSASHSKSDYPFGGIVARCTGLQLKPTRNVRRPTEDMSSRARETVSSLPATAHHPVTTTGSFPLPNFPYRKTCYLGGSQSLNLGPIGSLSCTRRLSNHTTVAG